MNGARGEVSIEIDGKLRRLCLTLGALAEIETEFGCHTLQELQARLRALSANDMVRVLAILLRGGGESEVAASLEVAAVEPGSAARAISEAFRVALA